MRIRYKFIIYLFILAFIWWGMMCKLEGDVGLTCLVMMFVSFGVCIGGFQTEIYARIAGCLCAFFWTGMSILVAQLDVAFGAWFFAGTLLSIAFNAIASTHSFQIPMNRDCC